MADRFDAIRLFIRVARTKSFSVAAREHGLSQPTVSRAIAALEREIGVALFARTSRAVALTDAGAAYATRVEAALNAIDEATDLARGSGVLRGILRVGTSSSFATRVLIPRLPVFMAAHPDLRVNLLLEDRRQDLIVDGIDVALRFGVLEDSSAVARKIHSWPRIAAAAPSYIARSGRPQSPADLANLQVISGASFNGTDVTFRKDAQVSSIKLEGRLAVSANEGCVAAAVAGIGIVVTTWCSCAAELQEGLLVQLLDEWDLGNVELHAVYAMGRQTKLAARALTEFLIAQFASN
jgi:DNA-binding transcriptional LysR family regulator